MVRYVVIYTRNDTGTVDRQQTTDRGVSIENLFPGAGYRVQVWSSYRYRHVSFYRCRHTYL